MWSIPKRLPASFQIRRGLYNESMTFKELYPELSDKELQTAEYNIRRYAEIVWEISQRIAKEASEKSGEVDSDSTNA